MATSNVAVILCIRLNGSGGNSRRMDLMKKTAHGAVGTSAGERQRHVGGSLANVDTGSEIESTSMCDSDEDDDDDCSSRLSSTATEQSDVQFTRRRRHKHQHRRRPAVVSYLLTVDLLSPVRS